MDGDGLAAHGRSFGRTGLDLARKGPGALERARGVPLARGVMARALRGGRAMSAVSANLRPVSSAARPVRSASKDWLRALELTARLDAAPTRTLPVAIDELARRFGDAPALISDRETFSFRALAERARRYARWALAEGVKKGDVVALVMPNRPEYMAVWLGLTRIGAVVALINTNLRGPALAHCLAVADAKLVIVDVTLESPLREALWSTSRAPAIWTHGGKGALRVDCAVDAADGAPFDPGATPVTLDDRALLIYTSGTTGLPKAANVSHRRVMSWSVWFAGLTGATPEDRLYNCLPMYHSVGGVVATGSVLVAGGAAVIAERFSASAFWSDINRFDCTMFQYIGELCRYLLAAPTHLKERAHRLRIACGNGLTGDVWPAFQERFDIPRILEFYAATEGAFSLFNVEGRPGAIGRIPPFLAHRFPVAIVRHDAEHGVPARGPDGFCIRAERGEAGEAIGRLSEGAGGGRFEGYTDAAESETKILRDVFAAGDAWMRTGDLMRQDGEGFFHFVDRIGDTFRWKGENVATTEVAQAIGSFPGVEAVSVFGVSVPNAAGRAGMAAVVASDELDLAALHAHLAERLPAYARPLFVRLAASLETTETFKTRKQTMVDEGFDPGRVEGALYFDDRARGAYEPLDAAAFAAIAAGDIRF
jgi:fatty-acyl-CoA synthase